jgi:hypothetical protein
LAPVYNPNIPFINTGENPLVGREGAVGVITEINNGVIANQFTLSRVKGVGYLAYSIWEMLPFSDFDWNYYLNNINLSNGGNIISTPRLDTFRRGIFVKIKEVDVNGTILKVEYLQKRNTEPATNNQYLDSRHYRLKPVVLRSDPTDGPPLLQVRVDTVDVNAGVTSLTILSSSGFAEVDVVYFLAKQGSVPAFTPAYCFIRVDRINALGEVTDVTIIYAGSDFLGSSIPLYVAGGVYDCRTANNGNINNLINGTNFPPPFPTVPPFATNTCGLSGTEQCNLGINESIEIIRPSTVDETLTVLVNPTVPPEITSELYFFEPIMGGFNYVEEDVYELINFTENEYEEKYRATTGSGTIVRVNGIRTDPPVAPSVNNIYISALEEVEVMFNGTNYELYKFYAFKNFTDNYPFDEIPNDKFGNCGIVKINQKDGNNGITDLSIVNPGFDFRVGQVYEILHYSTSQKEAFYTNNDGKKGIVKIRENFPTLKYDVACGGDCYLQKKIFKLCLLDRDEIANSFVGGGNNGVIQISNNPFPTTNPNVLEIDPYEDGILEQQDISVVSGGCNYKEGEVYQLFPVDTNQKEEVLYVHDNVPACVRIKTVQESGMSKIIIKDPGTEYVCPPTIIITDGTTEVEAKAIIEDGELCRIEVDESKVEQMIDPIIRISGGHLVNSFSWIKKLGHYLIDFIEVEVGGQLIDTHYGDWLNIWYELTIPLSKQRGYDKMIGNVEEMFRTRVSDRGDNTVSGRTLYIPLQFWFCKDVGNSLPLFSLQFHEVRLNVKFRSLKEVANYGPSYFAKIRITPPFTINADAEIKGVFVELDDVSINGDIIGETRFILTDNSVKLEFELMVVETIVAGSYLLLADDVVVRLVEDSYVPDVYNGEINDTVSIACIEYITMLNLSSFEVGVGEKLTKQNIVVDNIVFEDVVSFIEIDSLTERSVYVYYDYVESDVSSVIRYAKGDQLIVGDGITKITVDDDPILVPQKLYPDLRFQDSSLLVDYIYLDTDERERFAKNSHEYLVELLQFNGPDVIFDCSAGVQLRFDHPCKELVWVTQLKNNINRNNWCNYTDTVEIDGKNPVIDSYLRVNGRERYNTRLGKYFNIVQPFQHHTKTPANGVNVYSFAIKPEEHQPTGTMNMSRVDELTLFVNYDPLKIRTNEQAEIRVYATIYNVFRVLNGMGGLVFSN